MTSLPKIFAHRGAPAALPENTLEGFQHAIDVGADGLELDLLLTRDGVPVITHNPNLSGDTTRDAAGNWLPDQGPAINDLTLEELRTFDVGGHRTGGDDAHKNPHQKQLHHCRIPTLDEFLTLVKNSPRKVELLVELKHSPTADDHINPDDYVKVVADSLQHHGLVEQSYIHAFNWQILSAAARNHPQLRRSYLSALRSNDPDGTVFSGSPWMDGLDPDFAPLPELLAQSGASIWCPYFLDLDRENLTLAQEQGLQVMTWTVNGEESLRQELQTGVDGIITDDPKLALSLRAEMGSPKSNVHVLEAQSK